MSERFTYYDLGHRSSGEIVKIRFPAAPQMFGLWIHLIIKASRAADSIDVFEGLQSVHLLGYRYLILGIGIQSVTR
jgi:hypothetical protein